MARTTTDILQSLIALIGRLMRLATDGWPGWVDLH